MAVTILEALSTEKPCGNKIYVQNATLRAIYGLIEHHMAEIDEARNRGYSWKQIDTVCRELWKNEEECKGLVWWKSKDLIASCYRAIKKGKVPTQKSYAISKKRTAVKKYSVAVTEG